MLRLIQASRLSDCFHGLLFQSDGSRTVFRKFFSSVFLTVLFVLLLFSASSCYYSKSMSGEGYQGNHVYLLRDYGEADPSVRCPSDREPMLYLKEIDDTFFLTQARGADEGRRHEQEYYRTLIRRGYYSDGTSSKGENVSYLLAPGTLFRITYFFWDFENGASIYATILNGPLAGKKAYMNCFYRDFRSHLTPFEYPDGRTQPFGVGFGNGEMALDTDLLEDLGEMTDDELKSKGLWMEPGTDATLKAVMKPFPEGMDEFVFDGVLYSAQTDDVDAQLRLSQCYYEGAGVRKSRDSAERWLESAVNQTQMRDLELRLARMYADGWGARGWRFTKAEKIFRKYAEQGDVDAQFCLGLLLDYGYDWVKNAFSPDKEMLESGKESVQWYQKAADQGDARAMRALGMAYYEGERVEQDFEKAADWFKKAAELGDFAAQRNLGYLYLKGKGVKKDKAEARKWLEKAAAQGDPYATDLLKELED